MRKILFIAEGNTLAHVARPAALAASLNPTEWNITLARPPRYANLLRTLPPHIHQADLIACPPEQFQTRLAKGAILYTLQELQAYVRHDQALFEDFSPDIVIGDFRISLAVSARKRGIPYVALSNAYWSPNFIRPPLAPELPFTKFLPISLANHVFAAIAPLAFQFHANPMKKLRQEYGLSNRGFTLNHAYTESDLTLYCDAPELCPTLQLGPTERLIGHVGWAPDVPLPSWWENVPNSKPIVYINLGSSGNIKNSLKILTGALNCGVTVIFATAGRKHPELPQTEQLFTTDFIPGDLVARKAAAVICNGGSPATYQSLCEGTPVLGVPANLDQHLNMYLVSQARLGQQVRSDRCSIQAIESRLSRLLNDPLARERAQAFANKTRESAATAFYRELTSSGF
ncbi:MAG: glycosyl transferase family 1 [Betaproteobacteria bacterium]|nr:glycosyl transferase family 1 [Betaproteobacteria bacterium]